jgi:Uma2 family endonuclease
MIGGMNEHLRAVRKDTLGVRRDLTRPDLPWPATTQAAEGMPRRPWTRAEIEAMVAAGIIDEDERFELIGGEVVPMSPKGARHELVKITLGEHLHRLAGPDLWVGQETTLWLDEITFVEPDFCVWPRAIAPVEQRGYDVLLAIEIADTSLSYDRGRKTGIYAAYGISEVWVIDANRLVTHVHRRLGAEGYRDVFDAAPDADLVAERVPGVRVNLAGLGLRPLRQ